MPSARFILAPALLLLLFAPPALNAQALRQSWPQDTSKTISLRHPAIRYGKWLTLTAAAAGAVYGVVTNQKADDQYAAIEIVCRDDVVRCVRRPDGSFADAELERDYQEVLELNDRARLVLIGAQISLVASVALFIIDLPRGGSGEGIPYTPPRLQFGYDAQTRLNISYRFSR